MAFFVSVPVSLSGLFGNNTAWNDRNSALFLQPTYKLIAVIFLIASMSLPFKSKGSNRACAIQILFRFPLESKKRNGFPSPSVTAMDFRGQAPSAPSGFLVVSPFYPAGMLVDFDRGAVQHQRCFVHQILLHQGCEDIFLLSRHGTGCTHFAMARTAPADPSMVFRCSANTGLR